MMSAERPQNFSKENEEKERRGTMFPTPPLRNPHRKFAPAKTPGSYFYGIFLELLEEEAFVDLAGVAGLTQVVLFEGACAAGGVSAPAGDRLQVGTS